MDMWPQNAIERNAATKRAHKWMNERGFLKNRIEEKGLDNAAEMRGGGCVEQARYVPFYSWNKSMWGRNKVGAIWELLSTFPMYVQPTSSNNVRWRSHDSFRLSIAEGRYQMVEEITPKWLNERGEGGRGEGNQSKNANVDRFATGGSTWGGKETSQRKTKEINKREITACQSNGEISPH